MLSVKIIDAVPLDNAVVLVFFEDGKVKKFDTKKLIPDYPEFEALLNQDLFNLLQVEPGGYGISWSEELDCSEGELYQEGVDVPLCFEDFLSFCKYNLVTAKDAANLLGCTKQNIDYLTQSGKLHPVRYDTRYKLFPKHEITKRML